MIVLTGIRQNLQNSVHNWVWMAYRRELYLSQWDFSIATSKMYQDATEICRQTKILVLSLYMQVS